MLVCTRVCVNACGFKVNLTVTPRTRTGLRATWSCGGRERVNTSVAIVVVVMVVVLMVVVEMGEERA